jgi:class 3 adenylate cyclase
MPLRITWNYQAAESVRDFTRQSANMDARDVVDMLNHYFQPMVENIFHHDGTVDKFVGDAVNRASRFCESAAGGEVLISADVFQHVFNLIKSEKTTVLTKESPLTAYRVKEMKP